MNLETLTVKLTTDLSGFKLGMQLATQQTKSFTQTATNSFSKVGKQLLSGLGIAVSLGLITKFGKACVNAANDADSLYRVLSDDELDRWNSAIKGFNEQWERFKVIVGSVIIEALTPLVEILSSVLNILGNVANRIFNAFRKSRSEVDKTTKAMKSLKSLTGFDELNTVKTSDTYNAVEVLADIKKGVIAIAAAVGTTGILKLMTSEYPLYNLQQGIIKLKHALSGDISLVTFLDKIKGNILNIKIALRNLPGLFSAIGKSIITFISNPVGLIVAAVVAVVASIIIAYKKSEKFRDFIAQLVDLLKQFWESIKASWAPFIEQVGIFFKQMWNALQPIIVSLGSFVGGTLAVLLTTLAGILTIIIDITGWVAGKLLTAINKIVNAFGKIQSIFTDIFSGNFKEAWGTVKSIFGINQFANGGFPSTGSLFIANEAGPEMIGTIGNSTAVANNDLITTGIANAVYNAIIRAGGMGGNTNVTVQLDGQVVGKAAVDYNNNIVRRTGKSPLLA